MQTFEGRAFQTGETARAKALRQEHKLGGLPEHTAGDTAGVQSVPSTLYSSHPLTSELEDPSDTQGPAMEGHGRPGGSGFAHSHPWSTSLKFQLEAVISGNGRTHTGTRPGAGKDTEALGGLPRAQPGRPAGSEAGGTWLGSGPRRAT